MTRELRVLRARVPREAMTRLRMAAGAAAWPLLLAAVLAHACLAALAAVEYVRLGWLLGTRFDLAAVTVMLASALAGLTVATRVAMRAVASSLALRRTVRSAGTPCPAAVRDAAEVLGLSGRLDVVHAEEAFAVTYRLVRPRILVSDGLAGSLSFAELSAVLAHERCHLRCRDPLRLLAARLAAGYGFYLPVSSWLAGRLALHRELAADRSAIARAGRGALAGALMKLASPPACPAVAAASPAEDKAASLEARVAQLEDGRPVRPRLARVTLLATAGNLALLLAAGVCCAGLARVLPGGVI